jgi:hypothetical protein
MRVQGRPSYFWVWVLIPKNNDPKINKLFLTGPMGRRKIKIERIADERNRQVRPLG